MRKGAPTINYLRIYLQVKAPNGVLYMTRILFFFLSPLKVFNANLTCISEFLMIYLIIDRKLKSIYAFVKLQAF